MPQRLLHLLGILSLAITTVGLFILLYQFPVWQAASLLDRLDAKDRLAAEAALRTPLVPFVSAAIAAIGVAYTGRKFFLDRANQHIDRFNTAIAHLESDNLVTRAGGAAALQSIMQDSPAYRGRIRSILAYYLRENTKTNADTGTEPAEHLAAVLHVLRIRPPRSARGADTPLNLTGIRIPHSDLRDMSLTAARLTRADLRNANLQRANLTGANLEQVNLIGADLTEADLSDANLTGARLTNAKLDGTKLTGTDLTGAIGLTEEHIASSVTDSATRLPALPGRAR